MPASLPRFVNGLPTVAGIGSGINCADPIHILNNGPAVSHLAVHQAGDIRFTAPRRQCRAAAVMMLTSTHPISSPASTIEEQPFYASREASERRSQISLVCGWSRLHVDIILLVDAVTGSRAGCPRSVLNVTVRSARDVWLLKRPPAVPPRRQSCIGCAQTCWSSLRVLNAELTVQ